MPEIVVLSGKGGTGKTSLTAAFAHLAHQPIICDLDVDAPDLHLLLDPRPTRREDFRSGHEAVIDPSLCHGCGECHERCRFEALVAVDGVYRVDPLRCEGCKVCVHFCPAGAIAFPERHCGQWSISDTRFGPMVHAQLFPGQENSGRLVALLRQEARALARNLGRELILCDGAPGIGCPVISSLAGTDLAVGVCEPTPSGLHDLMRLAELAAHFRVPLAVIVNKADLSPDRSREIEDFCRQEGVALVASLPFDRAVVEVMLRARTVTECDDGEIGRGLRRAWEIIARMAASRPRAQNQPQTNPIQQGD
jgi:MinD superfamily P-loop ATPase